MESALRFDCSTKTETVKFLKRGYKIKYDLSCFENLCLLHASVCQS